MAVIVEQLGWGGKRQRYFTVEGNSVTIGRSYQNDVVLDDVYISPNHLRLDAAEGGWRLTDLQTVNGVEIIKNPRSSETQLLDADSAILLGEGAEIKIGRTRLRIVSDSHSVDAAKELHHLEQDAGKLNRLSIWLPLFLISLAVEIAALYFSSFIEWQWKNVFSIILGTQAVLLFIALFWGALGRFLRSESQFLSHYCLILLAGLAYSVTDWLIGMLAYNAGTEMVAMILSPLNALLILALLLSANFALATNMLPRQRWISSLGFVMLIIVVSITAQMSGWGEFSPYPSYFSGLEVPGLQFAGAESADDFIASFDAIFAAADRKALD
ncbi:FHA domain-containing protein [Porticoccaceae bacterium]|nr:FHA domain-containing protein [Porticoccaceae bacterium]MDC0011148.1 FHA domain-containing protein [Porticoccaceae bacterium]